MSLSKELKVQIFDYIKQPIPQNMYTVKQSIPVPFFGNIEKARVATISINPSNQEFEDKYKELLSGVKKRFTDRDILQVKDTDFLNNTQVNLVYNSLINYFYKNPYKRWFNWLDRYAGNILDCSYYNGTMVHLDIYPWATNPTWTDLNENCKFKALQGYKLLKDILLSKERAFDYVYINGKTVKQQIETYFKVRIPEYKHDQWYIYKYELANGTKFIGSSCYIQQSHKTTEELIDLHNILAKNI